MFAYSMGFDLAIGLLLGIILGFTNILCYTPEASRNGAIMGAVIGGALAFFAGHGYAGIFVYGVFGFVFAGLASLIERQVFRGGNA